MNVARWFHVARWFQTRIARAALAAAGGSTLGGCSFYHAQPLSDAAVAAALQPASVQSIRVAVEKYSHPLLKPLSIDGRDGFTPDEIALMTVVASPRLRATRDQRGIVQAQVIQAGLLPNPQLGYTLDQQYGNADPALINGESLGLSWDISALLAYRDRRNSAKATAAALDLDLAWQEWQAAQAARLSAYRVLSLTARLPLAREIETELAEALALAKKGSALGHKTTTDLVVAREAWSAAQDARFAIEQELAAQQLALRLGLGLAPDAPLTLKPSPLPSLPAGADQAGALLEGLEKRRLDLVALTLGYQSADASLRAAIKAQFPHIGISFARAHDTSDVHTRSFGATIDLPIFDRGQGQVAAGTATRQQLFDDYVARVAETRSEVSLILSNLAIARTQLATLEAELPELVAQDAALDRAMKTRNADAQAVRDARAALLARRAEQAKMRQGVLELGVALEIATGRPLLTVGAN